MTSDLAAVDPAVDPSTNPHIVQLFDAPRSLADAVSLFLIEGRALGHHLLVIARPSNWLLIKGYLEQRGVPVDDPAERITYFDAHTVRNQITTRGLLDPVKVRAAVEGLLAPHAASSKGLRIYGEVVELFAEEGSFAAAETLEACWNEVRTKYAFTLLCGYASAHFADPRHADHLRETIRLHTCARSQSADSLGSWLTTR